MADNSKLTPQSGIKKYSSNDIFDYALFLGGVNATRNSLQQYDPLRTGYNRIFFVQMPRFMEKMFEDETDRFRHILEYGFTKINGIGNVSLETEALTGGYVGNQFEMPTVSKDETTAITIGVYEFAGSPVREYLDLWISGIADPYTGLGHYHGALEQFPDMTYSQHNHVAEAIYVATDPTGKSNSIEYACLLSNMFPKGVRKDHFEYESGTHQLVQTDIEFTCTKYESPQINDVAKKLIERSSIMRNYMNFKIEYDPRSTAENHINNKTKHKNVFKNWEFEDYHQIGKENQFD